MSSMGGGPPQQSYGGKGKGLGENRPRPFGDARGVHSGAPRESCRGIMPSLRAQHKARGKGKCFT